MELRMKRGLLLNKLRVGLYFKSKGISLYDLFISCSASSDANHGKHKTLAHFDQITLSELSGLQFIIEHGMSLEMQGASAPGLEYDVFLSDTPFAQKSRLIPL